MSEPLNGVRVIELTDVFAGPTCTRFLGRLGYSSEDQRILRERDVT